MSRRINSESWYQELRPGQDSRFIVSVTAFLLLIASAHSLITPAYRGPDETQHVDMVIAVYKSGEWPSAGERYVDLALRSSKRTLLWGLRADRREEAEAQPQTSRVSWSELELEVRNRPTNTGGINPVSQHPFLYYALLAGPWGVLQSPDLDLAHDQTASGIRLLNLIFLAPLPLLTLGTAFVFGADRKTARTAVLLLLFVPQLAHIGGLVNNDNLLLVSSSLVVYLVARVLAGDDRGSTAALLGLALGFALLSKAFALVWIPVVAFAYIHRGVSGRSIAKNLRNGSIAAMVMMMTGGWWWIRNVILFDRLQPRFLAIPIENPEPPATLGRWISAFGVRFVDGFWGRFGTLDAPLPRFLTIGLWLATITLLLIGLFAKEQEGTAYPKRSARLYLVTPFVGIAVVIVANSMTMYLRTSWAAGMQGRYLFFGIIGIAVVCSIGLGRLFKIREGLLIALGSSLQLVAIGIMLVSWWGPREGTSFIDDSLTAWIAWSPWPPAAVAAVLAALIGIGTLAWWSDRTRFMSTDSVKAFGGERAPQPRRFPRV